MNHILFGFHDGRRTGCGKSTRVATYVLDYFGESDCFSFSFILQSSGISSSSLFHRRPRLVLSVIVCPAAFCSFFALPPTVL